MYLPPEYQLKLIRQRQHELHQRAEWARQLRGVRPVRVHVRIKAAWKAFQSAGLAEGRPATLR